VGLIIASDGRKMSKRFGNVINPDSIIKNFGADALRMYEMFMGPFDQSAAWGDDNIVGVRRFLDRVWRLSSKVSKATISNKNFEILLHKTIKKVSEDIESMSFNTAVSSMMILLNEMEKMESVNKGDFENFLKILNPFAPHITEEIWHNLGNKKLLVLESWPKADLKKMVEPEVKIIVQIDSKVRAECMVKKDASEEEVLSIVRGLTEVEKWVMSKNIARVIYVKNRLINLVLS
jgi:leucyl-tRNA synthetase